VLEDIASGLNENRKGLAKLFKLVTQRQIEAVFITTESLAIYGKDKERSL